MPSFSMYCILVNSFKIRSVFYCIYIYGINILYSTRENSCRNSQYISLCLQVQDLFTENKRELEETAAKLTVTKDKLVKKKSELRETKVNLRMTEQDRNEQKFLVSEHVKNETNLYENATSVSKSFVYLVY